MSVDSRLSLSAKRLPTKVALKWNGRDYTFGELDSLSTKFAKALSSMGIKKGDRVCIFMQNSPEFAIAHFGILKCGAVTVPLNVMYRRRELKHMINDSMASAIVTSGANLQFVQEVLNELKTVKEVIVTSESVPDGFVPFHKIINDFDDTPFPSMNSEEELAVICYTSGTTGLSKGAMLTHRNFLSNIGTLAEIWELKQDDKVMMALPMFHIHGLGIVIHGMAYCGYTVVLHERFDAAKVLEEISRERCTVFMGVPTMYIKLLEEKNVSYDVSSVRLWTVGSAPMPIEAFNKFKEKFGVEILERYGMTETVPVIASNPYRGRRKPGSVGPAIPGVEIEILDDDGKVLPPGEVGEIAVRGPNVMKGYWNRPVETEEAFSEGMVPHWGPWEAGRGRLPHHRW